MVKLTLKEAADAAGLNLYTLRGYITQGIITFDETDERAPVAGATARIGAITLGRLKRFSVIWKAGVQRRVAWRIACGDKHARDEIRRALSV